MTVAKRFEGKLAVITGGASGIGAATARRIASEGGRIVIADLQEQQGKALAAELGNGSAFHHLDVADEQGWEALGDSVTRDFGGLDILVNGAGVSGFGSVADTTVDTWRRAMDINALGTFLGCRLAVKLMGKGGSIVNLASCMAQKVDPGQFAYSASKAAIVHMTRNVAVHCGRAGLGIRCNSVTPGAIDTPMLAEVGTMLGGHDQLRQAMAGLHPIGRMGEVDEVAAVIAFLASDEASFVTGAAYAVDGAIVYG